MRDTAYFYGREHHREGWYWVPTVGEDPTAEARRLTRRDNIAWAVTFAMALAIWAAAIIREALA
jgi:hypothetical protein